MTVAVSSSSPTWNRLIRFIAEDGEEYLGEPVDEVMDIGLAYSSKIPIEAHILSSLTPWDSSLYRTGLIKLVTRLLSPISAKQAGTVRATGLSYKDHADEMNLPYPSVPAIFFKPSSCIANPDEEINIPKCCQRNEMDYEVELAIVLAKECKNVKEEDALDYVLGYTVANDLTARKHQAESSQWGYAKGFDKFLPLGPCILSTRSLPNPHSVSLETKVNGKTMQDGNASKMIFSLAKIISYLSQGTTLFPGTVIITGTPPGIGDGRQPKVWLADGDVVSCWITGIGTLVNTIKYE